MNGKRVQSRQPELWGATAETELVDITWVAKRLGVTVRHVRRLVAERRIPFIKWVTSCASTGTRSRSDQQRPPAEGGLSESGVARRSYTRARHGRPA